MEFIYYGLIIIIPSLLYIFRKKINIKYLSLILALIFFVRFNINNENISNIKNLYFNSPFDKEYKSFISILLIWFNFFSVLIIILKGFFNLDFIKVMNKTFIIFNTLISLIFLNNYFIGVSGISFNNFDIRNLLISLEVGLLIYNILDILLINKYQLKKHDYKYICNFLLILFIAPPYILHAFFGNGPSLKLEDLSIYHRLFIYFGFILLIYLHLSLRKKCYEEKRFYLIYISLATLLVYMTHHRFPTLKYPYTWPLHLCNTAMYISPICLIFKLDKVVYFTYFINVLGALLAIIMPNYGEQALFSETLYAFWVNHYMAFIMPILMISLNIFKRPKLKEFKNAMIVFFIYYVSIIFINAWLSNSSVKTDFFFTNSDFIAEKLGRWAENLRDVTFSFKINNITFLFYPIYQLLFYIVYVTLTFGVWFIYEQYYSFIDGYFYIKNKKKILMEKSKIEVKNMNDKEDKLILENFSKRYTNKYAVKNANLEVNTFEIFGFLGPNGAGKSTIIKSIVGIQDFDEGNIFLLGNNIKNDETKKLIGFVPDHYALYENLTGREYINYIADLYEVDTKIRNERFNDLLKKLELENSIDSKIKTYSHGMKQKIAIISALIHNPKLWILDEPLTGLDPNSVYQVKELMKEHASKGNIVFFSSHIIDVVEKICDRIAIIKKGNILVSDTVSNIEKNKSLESFYLEKIGDNNEDK